MRVNAEIHNHGDRTTKKEVRDLQALSHEAYADQISAQLVRVLASKVFIRSARLTQFLRFVVEQALIGNVDQLKERIIGVTVYDRKVNYDNRIDPIVRIEARRLRHKLNTYYTTIGRRDQIVIGLPKGAYLPFFKLRSDGPKIPDPGASVAKQSIVVVPFTNLTQDAKDDYFSIGLTEELTHRLTRIPELRVVAWTTSGFRSDTRPASLTGTRRLLPVDMILTGSVRRSSERVRVTVQLIASKSGEYLWSETYDEKIENMFATQDDVARAVLCSLEVELSASRNMGSSAS